MKNKKADEMLAAVDKEALVSMVEDLISLSSGLMSDLDELEDIQKMTDTLKGEEEAGPKPSSDMETFYGSPEWEKMEIDRNIGHLAGNIFIEQLRVSEGLNQEQMTVYAESARAAAETCWKASGE